MGFKDRLASGKNALSGSEWKFSKIVTTPLPERDVVRMEEWMLKRPFSGLLAARHINMRVTAVQAPSEDLRNEGDEFSITCLNPILGDKALATTVFSLSRAKAPTHSLYTFRSDTTRVRLGGSRGIETDFPASVIGSLAFNYGQEEEGTVVLDFASAVPAGNHARMVHAGIAARDLKPEIVTQEIVDNILVAFTEFNKL